ncbi:hypothetical protein M8H82_28160 [Streptomyces sp. YS415]|nr:hypothetical protein [Streptomyces sp. YS415]MCL7428975.1 hypothetical protein [Streptomyces sp. YS415]
MNIKTELEHAEQHRTGRSVREQSPHLPETRTLIIDPPSSPRASSKSSRSSDVMLMGKLPLTISVSTTNSQSKKPLPGGGGSAGAEAAGYVRAAGPLGRRQHHRFRTGQELESHQPAHRAGHHLAGRDGIAADGDVTDSALGEDDQ